MPMRARQPGAHRADREPAVAPRERDEARRAHDARADEHALVLVADAVEAAAHDEVVAEERPACERCAEREVDASTPAVAVASTPSASTRSRSAASPWRRERDQRHRASATPSAGDPNAGASTIANARHRTRRAAPTTSGRRRCAAASMGRTARAAAASARR